MRDEFTPLPPTRIHAEWLHMPHVQALVGAFEQAGEPLRFVGGAVRDSLLDRPVTDIDAATPASPQKVMSLLEQAAIKAVPTGLSHGTITAVIERKPVEITTLRRDVKTHGRHADVQFTTDWREDAKRRDFTMNAIYCDSHGQLYDEVGGIADAKAGHVRFIGEAVQRIREDGLRILRFYRFSAHYTRGALDAEGARACAECAPMIEQLSGERIAQEMRKFLRADRAAEMLEQMQQQGVLAFILPEIADIAVLARYPTVNLMAEATPDPLIALAILLRGLSRKQALVQCEWISARWKLSNKEQAHLHEYVTGQSLPMELDLATQKQKLRALGKRCYAALLLISWCERLQESPENTHMLAVGYRTMLRLIYQWEIPQFPLSGEDLLQAGLTAGPALGEWLKRLEKWWERENYEPDRGAILAYFESQR